MSKRNWRQRCMRSGTSLALALALGFAGVGRSHADAAGAQRPLLLELFTSQGCSSCPPADAVLRELSTHDDVLPLAFHIDYWNDLGWVDPFSAAAFTARQQDYAALRGFQVYTPQLVVEGRSDVVGSNRSAVVQGIAVARREAKSVASGIRRSGREVSIDIGATAAIDAAASADVYLISFDSSDSSSIGGGENAGRRLVYANVVRSMRRIGEWRNQPLNLTEQLRAGESGDRLALVVQDRAGTVWAVASTPAAGGN